MSRSFILITVTYNTSYRIIFFFSSRRRHTRLQGDWSSDVCSSDLCYPAGEDGEPRQSIQPAAPVPLRHVDLGAWTDRSEERRVGKSVDLGGRRIIKKKKKKKSMNRSECKCNTDIDKYMYRSLYIQY